MRHSRRYGAPSSALVSRSRACRPEVGLPRPSPRFSQVALRRCAVLRTPRADRRRRPLAPMPPSGATRKHGNADLWPVLPVGAGTAPRSGASGVYHAAVWMMLNAEVPAERRTTPELGVLPAARLRRAVPTGGRRSLACAPPCRPEGGVVLPTRHLVWAAVSQARKKLTAANFVRCRRDRGESVKGGHPPFHKSTTTNRNSPKRAEGAQGSFDSGAKRRAVRERGLNSFPLNNPNWSSDVPPLPNRSTRFTCRVPSRRRRSCRR